MINTGKEKEKKNNKKMKLGASLVKKILCYTCSGMKSFPSDLPEGHVRVYVGKDDVPCKFDLEANYLNHPLLVNLLHFSVEEFGYSYNGALRIACEIDLFQHLLQLLQTRNPSAHYMDLPDLISKFYAAANQNTPPQN